MNKERKKEVRFMNLKDLELLKNDLKFKLTSAKLKSKGLGSNPKMGEPTKLVKDIRKEVATINTFINQKKREVIK